MVYQPPSLSPASYGWFLVHPTWLYEFGKNVFVDDQVIDAYDTLGRGMRFDRITENFIEFLVK